MFGLSYEEEYIFHQTLTNIMLFSSIPIFCILHFVIPSPWGKTISNSFGPIYLPAKMSWFLFECINLIWCCICYYDFSKQYHHNFVLNKTNYVDKKMNLFLFSLFVFHYIHRAIIYPILMSNNTTPIPFIVVLSAMFFCTCNGYIQAQSLLKFETLPNQWYQHPQFILGISLFGIGMYINIQSDTILRGLKRKAAAMKKKVQEEEINDGNNHNFNNNKNNFYYLIPFGGFFEYISTPHYFGEIIEWIGFTIACNCSLASLAFCIYTASNLIPRGVAHHYWYQQKFKYSYPSNRKAIIPFFY